ncbi:sulfotransferase family protein [Myceligenerans salitolerans]|uniref:Sulfotransferase family protein n=1 Tax=Myceligenerans salitolerans TaxID=1230528 RepID=A0ABS3ID50_9MICO|nr:hypothetical protein [Myceligenerans salitolerans]MBO0610923.1 hypothetical protein [Myceligenerans salitolerans]
MPSSADGADNVRTPAGHAGGHLRRLVLIVGSGRSGTSTLTGVLKRLGMYVPQPEVPADRSNPRGFGEPQWVVDFHSRLLKRAGVRTADAAPDAHRHTAMLAANHEVRDRLSTWLSAQFEISSDVLVKDPRLLWFLDVWRESASDLGADVSSITMLRSPTEVVRSKATNYHRFSPSVMVSGWINTMLLAERLTRGSRRSFLRYADILADWRSPVFGMARLLDITPVLHADEELRRRVDEYIDPGLRRSGVEWDGLPVSRELLQLADDVWAELSASAEEIDAPGVTARLDALFARHQMTHRNLMASTLYLRMADRIPRQVVAAVPERVQARLSQVMRPLLDERAQHG